MFTVCKNYLKARLLQIGITDIRTERGAAAGTRQASYYTMPSRCRLTTAFENPKENVKEYIDPDDRTPIRVSGTTDSADNTETAVKDTDADFVVAGVVAGDIFVNAVTNKRAKVITRTNKNNLVLEAGGAGGNSVIYRLCDKDGVKKYKSRKKKADAVLTFVVEFQNRNLDLAYIDFLNFNRVLGKFFHDDQYAVYENAKGERVVDGGNKIQISIGSVEFGDNSYYPELINKIVQEVEFSGGIYIDPDPATGDLDFDPSLVTTNLYIETET